MPAVPFCQICYSSSKSDCEPTAIDSQEDWVALTDCGHVYHTLCVKRWWQEKNALGCPLNCAFRNVKSDKRTSDGHAMVRRQQLQEPMPYLRLYSLNWTEDSVCSSDPVDAAAARLMVKQERPPKKRARLDGDTNVASRAGHASADDLLSATQGSQKASTSAALSAGAARGQQDLERRILDLEADGRRKAREIVGLKGTMSDLRATIVELEASLERAQESQSDAEEECLRERVEIRAAGPWGGGREDDNDDDDREDFDPDEIDCECSRCRPTGQRRILQEQVQRLEQQLSALQAVTVPRRVYEASEAARVALQERFDETVRAHTAYQGNYDALRNDLHTERIQRRQSEALLRKQLDERGESGAAKIADLRAKVDERDNRIMHLQASIDRVELEAQQKIKAAEEATNRARQQASVDVSAAKERAALAEAARAKELSRLKRYEAANAGYERQLATLKIKLEKLKAKRGIVATESDVDEPAEPVFSNRTFARTTSSRSHFSLSPPPSPPSGVQVNNKSTAFATSPRKQRHARTFFDDWEFSRERHHGTAAIAQGPAGRTAAFDEEDEAELEYVDVATGAAVSQLPAASPRKARPTVIELSDDEDDDDDDVTSSVSSRPPVVTSSHFGRKAPAAAKGKAPLNATAPRKTGQQQLPFAALTNSITSTSKPTWKKPEEALTSKQDKWLPELTKGLVDTGSKRRVKRK